MNYRKQQRYPQSTVCSFLLAAILLLTVINKAFAEFSEYDVKAAMVLNFLKFTELPKPNGESVVVCVSSGDDAVISAFQSISNKPLGAVATNVRPVNSQGDLSSCSVLFVSNNALVSFESMLPRLSAAGTLTIGENTRFLSAGGIINFFIDDTKIRFEISAKNGAAGGIRFSSKLLSLAKLSDT